MVHIPRFHVDEDLRSGLTCRLSGEVAHHLLHVLRVRPDDLLIVFNGQGGEYEATIIAIHKRQLDVRIGRFIDVCRESGLYTNLGMGILKRDAMNTAIQKAVELGASCITPLETERTVVARRQILKRLPHWRQIARAASEQCGRNRIPEIRVPASLGEWLQSAAGDLRLIASPAARSRFGAIQGSPNRIDLLIGPEGGCTEAEESMAMDFRFRPVSLGKRILRAETVPLVLLSLMQHRWGDG